MFQSRCTIWFRGVSALWKIYHSIIGTSSRWLPTITKHESTEHKWLKPNSTRRVLCARGADTSVRRMRSAALPIQQQAKQKGGEVRFLSSLACEGKSLSPSSLKSSASTCTSDGPSLRQTKTLVPDWATTRQSSIHKIELFTEKCLEVVFTDD